MKRLVALLLMLTMLLCGCVANNDGEPLDNNSQPKEGVSTGTDGSVDTNTDSNVDIDTNTDTNTDIDTNTSADIRFDYNTSFHDVEFITSLVDPNFVLQDYGATGLSGAGVGITCMSFNVLAYNTTDDFYEEPAVRCEAISRFLREQDADLVGLQEVTDAYGFDWVETFENNLGDLYAFAKVTDVEYSPIRDMKIGSGLMFMYRKDRFTLIDSGCYDYWDDSNRMYHWILLEDKKSGREIYFINTHLSINNGDATMGNRKRCGEALELLDFWKNTVGDTAMFCTGDYNCKVGTQPHEEILKKSIYQRSLDMAKDSDDGSWLDFCYYNTKCMDIEKYRYIDKTYIYEDGTQIEMSDHTPVMTWAVFK